MTGLSPLLRVLIVDDERLARQRIEDLLAHEERVEIVEQVDNGRAAVEAIQRLHPDVVFLDVQMPGMSGLDVVRALGDEMPATIFVTAFDQHALQAFDLAALDYLVKPFDDERFEQAFRRARQLAELHEARRVNERLLDVLRSVTAVGAPSPSPTPAPPTIPEPASTTSATPDHQWLERIAVESRGKVKYLPVSDIDYIAASGPYAELVVGTRRHLIREPMHDLEARLDPARFMRIHRSAIVQLDRVDTLIKGAGGDYEVQLKDGTRLRVSRARRDEREARLANPRAAAR
jgi:two-component system LytT family response regulator